MSIDTVKHEHKTKKDVDWGDLVEHSESEIRAHQEKIKELRKSLSFFKKQASCGVPFPVEIPHRHKEIS